MQEVDLLLAKWDVSWAALARAEAKFEFSKCQIRPKHKLGHRFCPGDRSAQASFIYIRQGILSSTLRMAVCMYARWHYCGMQHKSEGSLARM